MGNLSITKTSILQMHMHTPNFKHVNNTIKIYRMSHIYKRICIAAPPEHEIQAHLQWKMLEAGNSY